jgi:hypothetical protein
MVPPTAVWTTRPVPVVTFFASTAICSASSRVGEMIMARMSSALAFLYPRTFSASLGSFWTIRCMTGMRKPSVLPVPVLACAMLFRSASRLDILGTRDTYMSTPLNASLMVAVCTSVMVVSLICLVMVLMMLGCTSPRLASSLNSVTGPSELPVSSSSAAAICCHLVL